MSTIQEPESCRYFTGPAERSKALNTLMGILDGVCLDNKVNDLEFTELEHWYELYRYLIDRPPFDEIIPVVDAALSDGVLDPEEIKDIKWCCQRISSDAYYNFVTASVQQLHGVLHGVLADHKLSDIEICNLKNWLDDHADLRGTYPFDEIDSLVSSVLEDGVVSDDERNTLIAYFSNFISFPDSYNLSELKAQALRDTYNISGICAMNPDIQIPGHLFCFTGKSSRASRNEIAETISKLGGSFNSGCTKKVEYLIVGNEGNSCWAYSCYGRKIENAIHLRESGGKISIINELDFWKAVEALQHG